MYQFRQISSIFKFCMGLLIVTSLSACVKKEIQIARPDPEMTALTYGDNTITVKDILIAFQETHPFEDILFMPESTTHEEFIASIGKEIAFKKTMAEQARELGLHKSERFITGHEDIVRDELYQKVLSEDIFDNIRFTDKEIHRFYDENKKSLFLIKDTNAFAVRGLYVNIDQRTREEAWAIANKAYQELEQGTPFETVAQKYSDAPLQKRGKENRITPGMAHADIERKLNQLEEGEYTDPFELGAKIFIFYLIDFIEPDYVSFEKAKEPVIQKMTLDKREQDIYFLSQELKKKHGCLINAPLLDDLQNADPNAIILSIPDVWELTLKEFLQLAKENQNWTIDEKKEYLTFLANKSAFLAEALSRGWTEKDVAAAMEFHDRKLLTNELIRSQVNLDQLTEEQMRAYFVKNRDKSYFQTPKIYNLYHLFVRAEYDSTLTHYEVLANYQQAKQQVQSVRYEVSQGRPFEEVIAPFIEHQSANISGHMGFVTLNQMDRPSQSVVGNLEAGEISEPERISIHSTERYGYELFYVKDMQPSRPMTFSEAKTVIRNKVFETRYNQIHDKLKKEFNKKYEFTVNDEAIDQIVTYLRQLVHRYDIRSDITFYEKVSPQES